MPHTNSAAPLLRRIRLKWTLQQRCVVQETLRWRHDGVSLHSLNDNRESVGVHRELCALESLYTNYFHTKLFTLLQETKTQGNGEDIMMSMRKSTEMAQSITLTVKIPPVVNKFEDALVCATLNVGYFPVVRANVTIQFSTVSNTIDLEFTKPLLDIGLGKYEYNWSKCFPYLYIPLEFTFIIRKTMTTLGRCTDFFRCRLITRIHSNNFTTGCDLNTHLLQNLLYFKRSFLRFFIPLCVSLLGCHAALLTCASGCVPEWKTLAPRHETLCMSHWPRVWKGNFDPSIYAKSNVELGIWTILIDTPALGLFSCSRPGRQWEKHLKNDEGS